MQKYKPYPQGCPTESWYDAGEVDAKLAKIAKDLCDLTPGGSEFYNDIDFCIKYLQDKKYRRLETIKRQVKRAKKAEAEVKELKEKIEER